MLRRDVNSSLNAYTGTMLISWKNEVTLPLHLPSSVV